MEQVNKEYKKTPVGIIPKDWNVTTLGNLLEFKNGLNKASEYFGFGTPIVNYMDVFKNAAITQGLVQGRVSLTRQEINNFSAKKGDVFFTRTSETQNEVGIASVLLDEIPNCVFSGFVLRGRRKSGEIVEDYYKYCLQSQYVRSQIISSSSYTTRALTNGRNLSKVNLVFPPTHTEQKAIADALSDVDALIANLEKLIAKKKAIKQGAMQQLLTPPHKGGKRLEGFSGVWKEVKLGDVCNIRKGQLITESSRVNGEIPVIAGGRTPAYFHNKPNRIGKTITISASGASAGYVSFHNRPIFASDCSTIEEGANYSIEFIYYFLQLIQERIYKMQTGGAQPHIHPSDLYPILIDLPLLIEQQTIAQTIRDMELEIQFIDYRLEKAKMLKQGMMQELLTGKTRLV